MNVLSLETINASVPYLVATQSKTVFVLILGAELQKRRREPHGYLLRSQVMKPRQFNYSLN